MWKSIGLMIATVGVSSVGLLSATPARADEGTFTANVALVTDYKFRGISQTSGNPAIQGGFDYTNGMFYAGTWASNVDFDELGAGSGIELDLYAGIRPTFGPISTDFGIIGYFYPGVLDIQGPGGTEGELDYYEVYGKASITPVEHWTLGAAVYYSPEFAGETGSAYYIEGNSSYAFNDAWSISGALGYQNIDDVTGVFPGTISDNYLTWNAGVTYNTHGFAIDLRYVGTDVSDSDPLIVQAFTTSERVNDSVILSIRRSL